MLKAPLYKQILSYLYPVRIRKSSSRQNHLLELFLYRGQYQLSTAEAYYSDGRRYRPLVLAFKDVEAALPNIKNVLLLGAGIGSAIQILMHKGYRPNYTMVDNDECILEWAMDLQRGTAESIETVHEDAESFMKANDRKYDLLVVDVFTDRVVPPFATTSDFLKQCRRSINPGGVFVMNYIINDAAEWNILQHNLQNIFDSPHVNELGINRVVTALV